MIRNPMVQHWALESMEREVAKGALRLKTAAIISILNSRFRSIPASVFQAMCLRTNLPELETLAVLATSCKSIREFKRALK